MHISLNNIRCTDFTIIAIRDIGISMMHRPTYIYMWCVFIFSYNAWQRLPRSLLLCIHNMHIYIYIYICVCVSNGTDRHMVSYYSIQWPPLPWASVHWLVQCTLESHWLTQCTLEHHWKNFVKTTHTGMPLEKLSWIRPTLGSHWKNSNFCSQHWNTTGGTVTAHTRPDTYN